MISLAEFTILCAKLLGSKTAHCALTVTERESIAMNRISSLFFMRLSPFFSK